ncbi:hypothetical protein [Sphingomonas psychrolutea]|uniref:Uncharacterized protein n=1 Tax=Sphingomonas psychrolutea TaxID=1259676 RepID=A0ABQ1H283_9SPHN|nr:hypothetical protein [Sphingomonas psychrolutea]GGA56217.1 hypothetical protein GCM10011395_28350 [Sphingomonas psychrolutea]
MWRDIGTAHASRIGAPYAHRPATGTEMNRRADRISGRTQERNGQQAARCNVRPTDRTDLIDGAERPWADVRQRTKAHLQYQRYTKIVDLAGARRGDTNKSCLFKILKWCRLQDSTVCA